LCARSAAGAEVPVVKGTRAMRSVYCLTIAVSLGWLDPAWALDRHYTCGNIVGINISAPAWETHADGFAGLTVTLISSIETGDAQVKWSNGNIYRGITLEMSGGFAILSAGTEYTEVYHLSISNLDLMMTATRGGSAKYPNATKAFHGTCHPGDK